MDGGHMPNAQDPMGERGTLTDRVTEVVQCLESYYINILSKGKDVVAGEAPTTHSKKG